MSKVWIIINAEVKECGKAIPVSPVTEKMVNAMKNAIAQDPRVTTIEVIANASLWSLGAKKQLQDSSLICCPLTIQLPDWLNFEGTAIYQACKDIDERRRWVQQTLHYSTTMGEMGLGNCWLPVIKTPQQILLGDIIGEGMMPNAYQQPIPISDKVRKPLYHLADQLLVELKAPSSVYLLQFSLSNQEIVFDRLWPFPAAPAIASLGSQQPDLFTCYWRCLTHQSLDDLTPKKSSKSRVRR